MMRKAGTRIRHPHFSKSRMQTTTNDHTTTHEYPIHFFD